MNKKIITSVLLVCAALAQTHSAVAHTLSGTLGSASTAIDYYQVQCINDAGVTDRLYLDIKKAATATQTVSLQVLRDTKAYNMTAPANGSTSAGYEFKGSEGYFYLTVTKTTAGAVNYVLDYHCKTSTNDHTMTNIYQLNNQ